MPNVEASKRDLERLIGKKLSRVQLERALEFAKGEIDSEEGDRLVIDVKDTNRPDLLSAEGIAREIRGRLCGEKGVPKYSVKKSGVSLIVDKSVKGIRPCIAAAIVKNVKISEEMLVQMINSQEKVCMTFGKKRKEAAIGIYDWSKLKGPMHYTSYGPREKKFIPLEYKVEMDLEEILLEHPKGKEYAHLLKGMPRYPIVEDSLGTVASMPPIINSQATGKAGMETEVLFVEVTGQNQETVDTALNVMVLALAERGFSIYSVSVKYPGKTIVTPDFTPRKISVPLGEIEQVVGMRLGAKQIIRLLGQARYDVKANGKTLLCKYPAYRQDILHPVDVIEDVLISHGFNSIRPEPIRLACTGGELLEERMKRAFEEACIGLGLQGVLTFTMTSVTKQCGMVGIDSEKERLVEIENPVSENYAAFRKRLYPELLEFLSKNKHAAYPQKIFEIGKAVELDAKSGTGAGEKNRLCVVLCGKGAEFTVIKGTLDSIAGGMGIGYSLGGQAEPAFEKGKSAAINAGGKKGVLGELSRQTLKSFGLEQPTAVLEIEI
jgi:phenylalanyl-tRNA synthetase beta chain